MQFLLNWPWVLSFFFVSSVTTAIAVAGLYLVRKRFPADVLKENDELRRMAGGDIGVSSTGSLRNLIAVFDNMEDKSIPNRELYMESLRRVNNLAEYRRLRIFAGNDTVPPMMWLVMLVGGLITVL